MAQNQTVTALDIGELFESIRSELKRTVREELERLASTPKKELLTVGEVAQEFGMTESYWRKQIFHRYIPVVKMGKSVRLRRSDVEKFIEERQIDEVA